MRSATVRGGLVLLALAGPVLAEEQPGQDGRKEELAALQGVWEKTPRAKDDKAAADRLQLRIKGDYVELRVLKEDGHLQTVGLRFGVGEVNGIKFLSLGLLGKSEVIAYSVDGDELVLAGKRSLFGREGFSLAGEWTRIKPDPKRRRPNSTNQGECR